MLCKTDSALEEEAKTADHARRLGVPADVLDATQTAALDPNVRMDIAGAVYFPRDCHITPRRLMAWLLEQVKKSGGEVIWQTEVTGWRRQGRRLEGIRTSH